MNPLDAIFHYWPALAAFAVAALIPRGEGRERERLGLGVIAAALVLGVQLLWPAAAATPGAEAAPPRPSGRTCSTCSSFLPIAGAISVLFLPRQLLGVLRGFTLAVMGVELRRVALAARRADDRGLALPVHPRVDPGDRHPLPRRGRRHQPLAGPPDDLHHADRDLRVVRLDPDAHQGLCFALLLLEGAMIGVVRLARPLPLLRVLGGDARPDVRDDRRLGRRRPRQARRSSSSSTRCSARC